MIGMLPCTNRVRSRPSHSGKIAPVRVLIVKTSSMGDIVHALPMVTDIARAFPHARIDWVVEDAFAELPRLHPSVSRIIPIALRRWRKKPFSRQSWRELLAARNSLRRVRYHTIIDCQGLLKSALVAGSARGPVSGFSRTSAREPLATFFYRRTASIDRRLHAVDRNRRLAAFALGYALDGAEEFGLRPPPGEGVFAESGAVLLLTNASRATKLWPDAHWTALERHLADRGYRCLLPWGSEAERQSCERRAQPMVAAQVLPRANLSQLASLAAGAALTIGLDTGLTHLAAATGTPAVGIYCDYDPGLVGLRGSGRVASLGGVGMTPSVAEVLAAVDRVLAHRPEPAPQ